MPDYSTINKATVAGGDNVATDEITDPVSGKKLKHQRVKLQVGQDGSAVDVSDVNPMPIKVAGLLSAAVLPLVDENNSQEDATLLEAQQFQGVFTDVVNFSQITVLASTSGATRTGNLYFDFSMDGTTLHRSINIAVSDLGSEPPHTVTPVARYFRVRYIPTVTGSNDHPNFQLQTILHPTKNKHLTSRIEQSLTDTTDVENVRAVITGQAQGHSDYRNVGVTDEGSLLFATFGSQSAFGDLITVRPNAEVSLMAAYTLDTLNATVFSGGTGTVVQNNSQIELKTGTTTLSDAAIASKDFVNYKPGFGATARFTWGVTTAGDLTGSFQQAGMGTQEDGHFFSYQDNDMSILTRKGGQRHIHRFTITTESTSAGTVGIELDGTTYNVSVSDNTGSTNATAAEIAADAQFALQGGTTTWLAYAEGNEVTFISERTGAKAGAFSYSAGTTGSAATVTAQVAGVAETTVSVPRTSWNLDLCDGTQILPLIDWSKGNVFQIRYQWLGYGAVTFFVENPTSGNLVPIHRIEYANANVTPSLFNPSLNFLANVANALTTLDVASFVSSVMASSDGGDANKSGTVHADTWGATVGNTNLDAIVSFRFPQYFASKTNRSTSRILRLTITASSAADIKILRNPVLGGSASWTSLGTGILAETDQVSTTAAGGDIIYADRAEKQDRFVIEAHSAGLDELVKAYPGDVITIAAQADTGSSVINVAVNWVENV